MTLIDRYVVEVARSLPRSRRSDISRELRSSLLDAVESRFGASATDEDAAVILREFGPPETVAASYRPSSQYLIGPEWYPMFSTILRINLMVLVAVLVIGSAFEMYQPASGANIARALASLLGTFVQAGLVMFGTVVLVFHLLERADLRSPLRRADWNPHDLPATHERDLVGRGEALTAIVFTAVGLVLLYQFKDAIGIPAGGTLLLNKVFQDYLPWLAATAVLTMAQYAVLLWQRRWHWYTRLSKLAIDVFGLYATYRIATGIIAERASLLQAGLPNELVTLILRIASAAPYVAAAVILFEAAMIFFKARQHDGGALTCEKFRSAKAPAESRG